MSVVAVLRLHSAYWLGTLARRMFAFKNEIKNIVSSELPDNDAGERTREWESKRKAIKVGADATKAPSLKKFAMTWLHSSLNSFEAIRRQAVCLGNWNSHARMNRELLKKSFSNDKVIKTKSVKGDDPPNVLRDEIICVHTMSEILIRMATHCADFRGV